MSHHERHEAHEILSAASAHSAVALPRGSPVISGVMADPVRLRIDPRRRGGWRRPGLYLVADGPAPPCGKLPVPLDVCPACGAGARPSPGWTWINATALLAGRECKGGTGSTGKASATPKTSCGNCVLRGPLGRAGLLWIGSRYYPTPEDFSREAREVGIARRIARVPRGFAVGETWILLAHRRAIVHADGSFSAAAFDLFVPRGIEYVVTGDESDERLRAMAARGIRPVRVDRIGETRNLFA